MTEVAVPASAIARLRDPSGAVAGAAFLATPELVLNRTLRLDPDAWFRTLCAFADRPYTPDELSLLGDEHAPKDRPCR